MSCNLYTFISHDDSKSNDQHEDSDDYEGIIVFIPTGMYCKPIPMLNYTSLYPFTNS